MDPIDTLYDIIVEQVDGMFYLNDELNDHLVGEIKKTFKITIFHLLSLTLYQMIQTFQP